MKFGSTKACLLAGLVNLSVSAVALAYDQPTHALITYQAYQKSVLNPSDPHSVVHTLMFDRADRVVPFLFDYADNQATNDDPDLYTREGQEEERSMLRQLIDAGRIPDATSVSVLEYRADGWLLRKLPRSADT